MKGLKKAFSSTIKATSTPLATSSSKGGEKESDGSGCPPLEGLLFKKNAHGEWKKRYGMLQGTFFMTYKPVHKKPTTEIKENIDLREVQSIALFDDVLEIEMPNGETLFFKYDDKDSTAGSIDKWYDALNKRHKWAETQPRAPTAQRSRTISGDAAETTLSILDEHRMHISGYLQKKSHNKYHGFQERFVKLQGKLLTYHKKKNDDTPLGTASMETTDFVRPFDASPDCAVFEMQDEDRVFVFQTPSHGDMIRWVDTINKVLTAYKEHAKAQLEAKIAEETPIRVRMYDEIGEDEFVTNIEIELSELYPTMDMEPDLSLKEHLSCATAVVQYLLDFVPEVQSVGADRIIRYDILAAVMTEVNATLTERFGAFLSTSLFDGEEVRHEVFEAATLGDLHCLIDWIATYQITLKGIKCLVSQTNNTVATPTCWLSGTKKTPKNSGVFEFLPKICHLYVHGGSSGAKGGASHHLYDHCMKVWESVVNNPEEMIQKHSNGSFYTHAPIDMWEAINQHMSLATSTKSPVLHVMIAEKVVVSLQDVFNTIITYVQTLDTTDKPELREIELEYISALANDTALHIEEVIELIDTFTINEIREKIDDIFDPLTTLLVQCGQACLKRLAGLVMSDVQGKIEEVFMPEWLEGNQVHVATATISDYMGDFETFLVEFWSAKFVYTILETVILSYIRVILFKKGQQHIPAVPISTPDSPAPKVGFFSSLMRKTKEISQKMTAPSGPQQVPVDEESLGRLAQDVNTFNAFFSKKAGQEVATEFLAIINEISLMLFLDGVGLVQHAAKRATEFPSAAQAIKEVALAIMRMRPETIAKAHFDMLNVTLDPLILSAPQRLREQEDQNIAEDRLSLLYSDLVPPTLLQKNAAAQSLAQRMKNMSHINLGATNKPNKNASRSNDDGDEEDGDGPDSDYRDSEGDRSSGGRAGRARTVSSAGEKRGGLVDDVMQVLNAQDQEDAAILLAQEEERQREEALRKRVGVLSYDGHMEKRSPATNLWQRRWYKLSTRETMNPEHPYTYNFMWYKTEGGAVIKSIEADNIESISVLASPRALAYLPLKQTLMLQSEALNQPLAMVVKNHDPEVSGAQPNTPAGNAKDGFAVFRVLQKDGKDHELRSAKVDRIIKWINLLSLAASLGYDERLHTWTRGAFITHQETAEDYAAQHAFMNISASKIPSNPKINVSGSPSTTTGKSAGGKQASPGANAPSFDPDDAAAAIKAMKLQEMKREEEERAQAAARRAEEQRLAEEEEQAEADARAEEERQERAARAAAAKLKAEHEAAARKEEDRRQRAAEAEAARLAKQAEEERLEQEALEREQAERQKRAAARQSTRSTDDDGATSSPTSPGNNASNPILQQDGKARDVANPLKRVSSVRRVPPPPPPPADEGTPTTSTDSAAATTVPTKPSRLSDSDSEDGETSAAPAVQQASKPPVGAAKVIRMVGKRRASQQKLVHNAAAANTSENGSTISGSSQTEQSDDDGDSSASPARNSFDDSSNTAAVGLSPTMRNLKNNAAQAPADASPASRASEGSPAGGLRKSLSRGVSFASDVKKNDRSSEVDDVPPSPSAASPIVNKSPSFASRAPFSSAPIAQTESTDNNDEDEGGADVAVSEQDLQVHAQKAGVVSGRMYRKSVIISKKIDIGSPPQKEGYLMKKSPAMFAGWQKRYFLTNGNGDIEYYLSESDAHNATVQPQGVIMVKYIKTDKGVEVEEKEISIHIGAKNVRLKADSTVEARAWLSNITQWQLHTC